MSPQPLPNVNVIFHGLFLFVQQDHYIDVLIPNMGTGHVYRAGAFLAEETLEARPLDKPYGLSGVTPGNSKFDNTKNVVFANQDFDHNAGLDRVYARIVLPYPSEILSLRRTTAPISPTIDPAGLFPSPPVQIPDVQVLRYVADDLSNVFFLPHPGQLSPNRANTFLNLHIIAEEDHTIEDQVRDGFESILSLLPGIRTPIVFGDLTNVVLEKGVDDPERGFSKLELLDLVERNDGLLAPLGATLQDAKAKPMLISALAIDIDEPPFDCWALICDNGNA